jgi:hypothetical protein
MTGTEIYKRSATYEQEAKSIRLHAPEWKLLLSYDGQRSLAEVALSVEVAFVDALPLTEKFLDRKWIEEQPITLDQFLKRTGAADASAIGSAVTPAVVLHEPKTKTTILPSAAAAKTAAAMERTASGRLVPPKVAPITRTRGPMKLSAVVDYIVSQVGNSSLGQLMVYRIFLRVPPQLLQLEDIVSVHLVNDPSLVRTEPLKEAISAAVVEVLRRPLPESVFAPA